MSINLSIKQIMEIASFAGLVIDEESCFSTEDKETMLEQEFVLTENQKVDLEDGTYYEGMTVHCAEYPEEGAMQLEDKEPIKRDIEAEKFAQIIADNNNTGNYLPHHEEVYKILINAGVDLSPLLNPQK